MEDINKSVFTREYIFKSYPYPGRFAILAHPKACFFCDHCTDIFYDSRGPYGCDRCGTTEFLPYISTTEFYGGYTRADNFEKPKEPWALSENFGDMIEEHKFIDLCPKCRKEYFEVKNNFLMKGQH